MQRTVFIISDRTGITAELLGRSLLTQFKQIEFHHIQLPFVDSVEKAEQAREQINLVTQQQGNRAIVFYTFIKEELRNVIKGSDALVIDLFSTFIDTLEKEFNTQADDVIGLAHGMGADTTYKARIDAINFALNNDDGMRTENYKNADLILIGVSRSGKTPTCLYLALQYGILAANFPLTEEAIDAGALPTELKSHAKKLFGLTIDPIRLHQIRAERLPDSRYASMKQCKHEINIVESIYRRESIPFIDTSHMSIEEIATTILHFSHVPRRILR